MAHVVCAKPRNRKLRYARLLSIQSESMPTLICCSSDRVDITENLVDCIRNGNAVGVEYLLRQLLSTPSSTDYSEVPPPVAPRSPPTPPPPILLTVKKSRHCYQQCSPLLWAIDCGEWAILSLLREHGFPLNHPLTCMRWITTSSCSSATNSTSGSGPSQSSCVLPYRAEWRSGSCTYQSALDYYFASFYETANSAVRTSLQHDFGQMVRPMPTRACRSHPLSRHLEALPKILRTTKGIDVHRLDSVPLANSMALSLNHYLATYANPTSGASAIDLPDLGCVPPAPTSLVDYTDTDSPCATSLITTTELDAIRVLIEHGFSRWECLEFSMPSFDLVNILLVLMCHPRVGVDDAVGLPRIVRAAAGLLANLLALRCGFPRPRRELAENLEVSQLRKLYYHRHPPLAATFAARVTAAHADVVDFAFSPLPLALAARLRVRRLLGSTDFEVRLAALPVPPRTREFLRYIDFGVTEAYIPATLPARLAETAAGNRHGYR